MIDNWIGISPLRSKNKMLAFRLLAKMENLNLLLDPSLSKNQPINKA